MYIFEWGYQWTVVLNLAIKARQLLPRQIKSWVASKKGIGAHDENIVLPLYKSLVRPHKGVLRTVLGAPVYKKDIVELECRGGKLSWLEVWGDCSTKTGYQTWGYSAWKKDGLGGI